MKSRLIEIGDRRWPKVSGLIAGVAIGLSASTTQADIAATHIYHNHMPNFWPYYDVSRYDSLPVGAPIRYAYDGQVKRLKANPPPNYRFFIPGSGAPMPHDDIEAYYSHHAKKGAYLSWPMDTARGNHGRYPLSQTHVTMSAAVINNVQSFAELGNQAGYNLGWGEYWRNTQQTVKTSNGFNALDTLHFTGHHSMGPLAGNDYLLKDLIYHNVTLAQDYFLGSGFKSSKGYFPTELGFSERIIPVLTKLGIAWSVLGNVHYSRTLRDYPYLNDPGIDTLVSPPNRADLRNTSDIGSWVSLPMFNEQQVTQNKFPFASIPHWVHYLDPETGQEYRIAGIPVEQASSWEEGYQGQVTAGVLKDFEDEAARLGRVQYFVIAHDGDNSQGRAGDGGTWANSGNVTYADSGVTGMGVEEYLRAHPIPDDDVVHVQDGSWIDTRDSSADPTWYHWHLPMGVWDSQMAAFNQAHSTDYVPVRKHMPSLELGYHYLERNFALLQAAENYAKTAEQIWLDTHPDYWRPSTDLDKEITYPGNQLNPWMMSYPVKGDPNNDFAGGANPAELAWYFLIASIDSGFGYYDENVDDGVKPTLSFNQSLYFSRPYVEANLGKDRTGPSVWWPQRYPYNPGSANKSKAEGWNALYANNLFAVYTYAHDASGIADIRLKVRVHTHPVADARDKTFKLYDPAAHASDPDVDPGRVGEWVSYPMKERNLNPDINGVSWQPSSTETFQVVPAQLIGNLHYAYLDQYRGQLLDYYIEAVDTKGNVTKSPIQQVHVGLGRFKMEGGKQVEALDGDIEGTHPFFTDQPVRRSVTVYVQAPEPEPDALAIETREDGAESWRTARAERLDGSDHRYFRVTDRYSEDLGGLRLRYAPASGGFSPSEEGWLFTEGTYTLMADGSVHTNKPADLVVSATLHYHQPDWDNVCMHYRVDKGEWTQVPGVPMKAVGNGWFAYDVDMGSGDRVELVPNDCAGTWDNNGGRNYQVSSGEWSLKGGTITAGAPVQNIRPVAVITPSDQQVKKGTVVTLSAANSRDEDGSIESYRWSTGATTPRISITADETVTVSVTVTDNDQATDSASATIRVPGQSRFESFFFRGTPNGWCTTPMELVADDTWRVIVDFDGSDNQRFKFDVTGDWSHYYGDNDGDDTLDRTGGHIRTHVSGPHIVELNSSSMTYRLIPVGAPETTPTPSQ
jgi:hypothetical protein